MRHLSSSIPRKLVFPALFSLGATAFPLAAASDDAKQIAQRHADNWTQTLEAAQGEDIMELYASSKPTVIFPSGRVVDSQPELENFWHGFLDSKGAKTRMTVADAHFNSTGGREQSNVVVAKYLVVRENQRRPYLFTLNKTQWRLDTVLTRQTNGQWKTQLQNWH
ncbi:MULTISPECIES: hypothetical protein [Methylomonas]|uniref:hypothetical protein n=1 Tax=Methylomonas TaxID=416 RepID=UPI0012320B7D|nr:hypothetical protein [Methylomonas rhizoryzae]